MTAEENALASMILRGRDHWADLLRSYDPLTWATETAKIRLPKGDTLDFGQHPFLAEPYRDIHEEIVFLKGAQLGFSTLAIIRALWAATTYPISLIYTFPTVDDVSSFTATRINPMIAASDYLRSRLLDSDSVRVKQFSQGPAPERVPGQRRRQASQLSTIYFNGAQTEKDATTVDADLLIHDEEDRSNAKVIEQYESRLDHSRYQWKVRLSTPTIPGAGIDRAYKASDQRVWLIRCSHCNHDFVMNFPDNIRPTSIEEVEAGAEAHYICDKCGGIISDEDRAGGRWVAMASDRARAHGYAVSQMAAPWVPAERILQRFKQHQSGYEGDFWNLVMGQAWISGADELTREVILSRTEGMRPMATSGTGCYMGVDVGSVHDVVIGSLSMGIPRTVYMGRIEGYANLTKLLEDFGVICCVIDALPDTQGVREWQAKHPQVWRATYSKQVQEVKPTPDERKVTLPRDLVLTQSAHELLTTRLLPRFDSSPAFEAYIRHHENSKKIPVMANTEGGDEARMIANYTWQETGADHMFHAATYEMVARMLQPPKMVLPKIALIGLRRDGATRPLELNGQRSGEYHLPVRGRRR